MSCAPQMNLFDFYGNRETQRDTQMQEQLSILSMMNIDYFNKYKSTI